LGNECRAKAEKGEVQRLLRQLQAIRVGTLEIATQDPKRLLTQIPLRVSLLFGLLVRLSRSPELNALLARVGLVYSPNRQPGLRCSLKRQATLRFTRESVQNGGKVKLGLCMKSLFSYFHKAETRRGRNRAVKLGISSVRRYYECSEAARFQLACILIRYALRKRNLRHFGRTIEPERKAYHADPAAGVDLARADSCPARRKGRVWRLDSPKSVLIQRRLLQSRT
jgi:hypothetical protein